MADQDSSRVDPDQVAEIVSSYVRHHQVPAEQLTAVIVEVHRALAGLGRALAVLEPLRPAVPIQRSVHQDYLVCLECGFRAQALRRHLRVAHGLQPADYRTRWQLPMDYPLTAPGYSARRSRIAKEMGLGRHRAEPRPPVYAPSGARRAGRRPRRSPAT